MPELNLQAFLKTCRANQALKVSKAVIKARLEQRTQAERLAEEHVQALAKRKTIENGLAAEGLDAMRFRWLGEHAIHWQQLAGLGLHELRLKIDTLIKQETIRRLSELRRQNEDK